MYNFHPPLSSFPLPLLVLLLLIELTCLLRPADSWHRASLWLSFLTLIAILAAFFSGYQGADRAERGFKIAEELIHDHHLIGKLVLFSFVPCLLLRVAAEKAQFSKALFWWSYRMVLIICCALALYAGYLGGRLVFEHGAGVRQPELSAP